MDTIRKRRKIMTEKKRRGRINKHLLEMKTLLLELLNARMNTDTTKLEHSEVLQMAVSYFKCANKGVSPVSPYRLNSHSKEESSTLYNTGYATCASEVSRFLDTARVDTDVKENIERHLVNKVTQHDSHVHGNVIPSCRQPRDLKVSREDTPIPYKTEDTNIFTPYAPHGQDLASLYNFTSPPLVLRPTRSPSIYERKFYDKL